MAACVWVCVDVSVDVGGCGWVWACNRVHSPGSTTRAWIVLSTLCHDSQEQWAPGFLGTLDLGPYVLDIRANHNYKFPHILLFPKWYSKNKNIQII